MGRTWSGRAPRILAAFAGLALAGCVSVPDGVTPVTGFDVDRYMGTWYEIARLDHRFERGLSNVTATYQLQDDGSVRVINRGRSIETGVCDEQIGRATFNGDPTVASLAVSFFEPFAGGYHVIELASDYSYAVVSGPTKGYYWILSRTPQMNGATLDRLLGEAQANGYPIDTELTLIDQSGQRC
jgi:apolipoprotein D and lipocalin family protein